MSGFSDSKDGSDTGIMGTICSLTGEQTSHCIAQVSSLVIHGVSLPIYVLVVTLFLLKRQAFEGSFYTFAISLGLCDIVNICIGIWSAITIDYYLVTLFTIWLLGLGSFFTLAIAANRLVCSLTVDGSKEVWSLASSKVTITGCIILTILFALPSAFYVTEINDYGGTSLVRNASTTEHLIAGQMITLAALSTMTVIIYLIILAIVMRSTMRVTGRKFSQKELKVCVQAFLITVPVLAASLLLLLMELGAVDFIKFIPLFQTLVTLSRVINPVIYLAINTTLRGMIGKCMKIQRTNQVMPMLQRGNVRSSPFGNRSDLQPFPSSG